MRWALPLQTSTLATWRTAFGWRRPKASRRRSREAAASTTSSAWKRTPVQSAEAEALRSARLLRRPMPPPGTPSRCSSPSSSTPCGRCRVQDSGALIRLPLRLASSSPVQSTRTPSKVAHASWPSRLRSLVLVPAGASGMGRPLAATWRCSSGTSAESALRRVASRLSKELSHQWGMTMTRKPWVVHSSALMASLRWYSSSGPKKGRCSKWCWPWYSSTSLLSGT
mmetsp:Transcript_2500/g.8899  ORF Transcript_2500/g.8899 Transcript_2500/m.8899 type:complete len:225 (-) Transcript_2500:988-1662(-)